MTILTQYLTKFYILYFGVLGLIFLTSNSYSAEVSVDENVCEKTFEVLVRSGRKGYAFVPRKLEDLYCGKGFEGKYFKVVYKKENKAITFDSDPELIRRAANVYYHLTTARKFWVETMDSQFVKELEQITVRVQITNGFSRLGHFTNDELLENYNNAWTIPEGRTPRWAENQDVWGKEIWFSPMKKIESRRLVTSNGQNPLTTSLRTLETPIVNYTRNSLTFEVLDHLAYPEYQSTSLLQTVVTHMGVMAVMFGSIQVSKYMDKLFMEKYYYLDTAMIPEVIYHEFGHVALSDKLKPVHSIAVIEGMADYFATRIANTVKMYRGIKQFSNNAYKNAKSKKFYHPAMEHENNADSDFTLSLLWRVRSELQKANAKRATKGRPAVADIDKLIYQTRKKISFDSSIIELTQALKRTCYQSSACDNKRLAIGALNKAFVEKGL